MEFRMMKQAKDDKGSPIFGFQVFIEGVEGGKGQGFSKKEAQQLSAKETLQRLRREPQFIDAIFQSKSQRTKMEEEPTMAAPNLEAEKTDFIIEGNRTNEPQKPQKSQKSSEALPAEPSTDEFDLSDITHNPVEASREDIIAAAEAQAFAQEESN
jgi:ribonuclease-3